jgi:hypothetical protein
MLGRTVLESAVSPILIGQPINVADSVVWRDVEVAFVPVLTYRRYNQSKAFILKSPRCRRKLGGKWRLKAELQ